MGKVPNLREKISTRLGFEPGSPALRADALPTEVPKRTTGPNRNVPLILSHIFPDRHY